MKFVLQSLMILAALALLGCQQKSYKEEVADAITDQFVMKHIKPLADPVARAAHMDGKVEPALLESSRITEVEIHGVHQPTGANGVIFRHEEIRPQSAGMVTGTSNTHYSVGVFYPATREQAEIEVRMNFRCDICRGVSLHLIVPNPLLEKSSVSR